MYTAIAIGLIIVGIYFYFRDATPKGEPPFSKQETASVGSRADPRAARPICVPAAECDAPIGSLWPETNLECAGVRGLRRA